MTSIGSIDADALPTPESLGLARLVHREEVTSTMDIAHELAAAGAAAGTLVLADRQMSGRGRGGHRWTSEAGAGLWMTLVERPADARDVSMLSLRLGLALADALSPLVDEPVALKWPNDVFVGPGKVAGILVEARWRDTAIDWVAIGIGINRRVPSTVPGAAAVRPGVSRGTLLAAVVPGLRDAARRRGPLSVEERGSWHARDLARGRSISRPLRGVVEGIAADGALLVMTEPGRPATLVRTGSIVFDVAVDHDPEAA